MRQAAAWWGLTVCWNTPTDSRPWCVIGVCLKKKQTKKTQPDQFFHKSGIVYFNLNFSSYSEHSMSTKVPSWRLILSPLLCVSQWFKIVLRNKEHFLLFRGFLDCPAALVSCLQLLLHPSLFRLKMQKSSAGVLLVFFCCFLMCVGHKIPV